MERNLLITMRFLGTNYHGFQVQKNALGVCTVFQDAVEKVFGARHDVKGCSRTDAGVHAAKYCVSMRTDSAIPCDKVPLALNAHLPGGIAVTACRDVPPDFHARYSATGKEYRYQIHASRIRDPFSAKICHRVGYTLDADMLNAEAGDFVGTHDFAAFQAKGGDLEDTVRTITRSAVRREGEMIFFTVRGDGFLYKMVRIMTGTLLHIAAGRLSAGCIPEIIASRDRMRAGKTAPACGLTLSDVFYDLSGEQER